MKNEYEIRGEVTAVIINSRKHGRHEALISTSKLERVKDFNFSWCVSWNKYTQSFYATGHIPNEGKQTTIRLHSWIINPPKGMHVDHINHDTLDNTDENLRVLKNCENQQNRKGSQTNNKSSGIRGVTWHKHAKKWVAQIKLNGKNVYLGAFTEISEAENAAVEARERLMPFYQGTSA